MDPPPPLTNHCSSSDICSSARSTSNTRMAPCRPLAMAGQRWPYLNVCRGERPVQAETGWLPASRRYAKLQPARRGDWRLSGLAHARRCSSCKRTHPLQPRASSSLASVAPVPARRDDSTTTPHNRPLQALGHSLFVAAAVPHLDGVIAKYRLNVHNAQACRGRPGEAGRT